jgi:hypothetical protein
MTDGHAPPFSPGDLSKDLVGFSQRFFASNVEPFAFELECFHGRAPVEPLHKTTRLIWVVAGSEISCEKGKNFW